MALFEKQQDYLGDLHTKSMTELQELLKRQQKLVSNPNMVRKLPDRGSKILALIEKIKDAMSQLENVEKTADLFEKMALQSENVRRERLGISQMEGEEHDMELVKKLPGKGTEEKIIIDLRENGDDDDRIVDVSTKILKKADKQVTKLKFRPNRTIRNKDVNLTRADIPVTIQRDVVSDINLGGEVDQEKDVSIKSQRHRGEDSQSISKNSSPAKQAELTEQKQLCSDASRSSKLNGPLKCRPVEDIAEARGKLRYRYDESLETQIYTGQSSCEKAKMITVEDSVKLLQNQQKTVQELQARYAAEKLAERLHIKMEEFNPEAHTSSYRDQVTASDSDDEVDDNMDYPD